MPVRRRKRTITDYMRAKSNDYVTCAAVESARKIGNQWRLIVIRYLLENPMRFNELLKVACAIDAKTLFRVLKYLVSEKIVRRDVLGTQPSKVLTITGTSNPKDSIIFAPIRFEMMVGFSIELRRTMFPLCT